MSTVTATVVTADQVLPISPAAAGYHLTLTEAGGAVLFGTAAMGTLTISVPDVPPGTYTATVAVVDATGAPLVPAVAAAEPIVVSAPAPTTVTVAVPVSLTVSAS
jgi:hypothetical protein